MQSLTSFVTCSRRGFLRLLGAALGATALPALTGCAASPPPPEWPFFDDGTGFEG